MAYLMCLKGHYQLLYPIKLHFLLSTHWDHTLDTEHNKRDISHHLHVDLATHQVWLLGSQLIFLKLFAKVHSYVNLTHTLSSLPHMETKPSEMALFYTQPELFGPILSMFF